MSLPIFKQSSSFISDSGNTLKFLSGQFWGHVYLENQICKWELCLDLIFDCVDFQHDSTPWQRVKLSDKNPRVLQRDEVKKLREMLAFLAWNIENNPCCSTD